MGRVVKSFKEGDDGGLAAARWANEGNELTGLDVNVQVGEGGNITRGILERNVSELNVRASSRREWAGGSPGSWRPLCCARVDDATPRGSRLRDVWPGAEELPGGLAALDDRDIYDEECQRVVFPGRE